MELIINRDTVIKSVQDEFNSLYPYLKIEFLSSPKKYNGHIKLEKLPPTFTFRSLTLEGNDVAININRHRTVADIEKDFQEVTGLSIQLYRKSGKVWIETSLTDDWTLGRQNDAGEVLSFHHLQKTAG